MERLEETDRFCCLGSVVSNTGGSRKYTQTRIEKQIQFSKVLEMKQEVKGIWRRLHRMTSRTRHAAYTARTAADLSRVTDRLTDRQTDTANSGKNSQHLMHSMQSENN